VQRKSEHTFYFQRVFSPKIIPFLGNMETYGTVGQATDDNIRWRMRIACWINKATHTHNI